MCKACESTEGAIERPRRRSTLWELGDNWHCTIIGTCLSMGDLRALTAKLKLRLRHVKAAPTDYEIHAGVIQLAGQDRLVAKALNKLLDHKHAVALTRFKRANSVADLDLLWTEALEKGEVAGACWAVMSHPVTTEDLRRSIFGEIHMLSHQVGATARADLRRIQGIEREKAALEAKIARQQERQALEMRARDKALKDLRQHLERAISENSRLAHAANAATELETLRAAGSDLQRHLALESEGRREAETVAREAEHRAVTLSEAIDTLRNELSEARADLNVLETRMGAALGGDGLRDCVDDCGRPDLCGRCILFAGGRAGQVQHMRRIVESCNGTLVHHDGGFEDGMGRLNGLFGQADTVMFPVDCVSHMAQDQLKRLCKRWEKPFVPVRRSGLGAFMRALETVQGSRGLRPLQGCRGQRP